jgi:hypothetical protein
MDDYKAKEMARDSMAKALAAANPGFVPVSEKVNSLVAAAKNMRIELKAAFPRVKFAVRTERYSGGNSINVDWEDGPVGVQVEAIIFKYSGGNFDGMTDSYEYRRSAWTDAFGKGKYVFANRRYSDVAVASALRTVFARGWKLAAESFPDSAAMVSAFRKGNLWNVRVVGADDCLQTLVNRELSRRTWAITKGCDPFVPRSLAAEVSL